MEEVLNERLGWTGLGHCDGGDMGSGTVNIFCVVVDFKTALPVIVRELESSRLAKQTVIVLGSKEGDDRILWPPPLMHM